MFENDFRDTREMNRQDRDEQMELAAVCHRDAYGRGGRCGGGWDRGGPIMIGPEPPILIPPRPPVFVMPMPRYGGDCYGGGGWGGGGCGGGGGWQRGYDDRWNRGGWDRGYDYYPMQGGNYSRDTVQGGRDGYSADRTRYNGGGYSGGGWNGGGGYYDNGWDRGGQVFDFALRGFDAWAGHDIARRYANNDRNNNDYGRGGGGYNDRNNRGNYQRGWQR